MSSRRCWRSGGRPWPSTPRRASINALVLDATTLLELVDEATRDDIVLDAQGRHHAAGMVILQASFVGPRGGRRIVLPVHAELGDVIQAQARRGAAA